MKKKINHKLLLIAALAIITTLLSTVAICYRVFGNQVVDDLRTQAQVLERLVGGDIIGHLDDRSFELEPTGLRVTVIDSGGVVIYDSGGGENSMGNHLDRPEIKRAWESGEGWAIRRSDTRDKNTFYYAMLIADGNILRVSREAGSVFRIYTAAIPIIIIVSAIIFVTCIFVAHLLTRSLMRPVQMMADHLTYSGPTSADVNGSDRENQLIQNSPKMNRSKIYPAKTDQMEINHEEHVTYEELQPLLDTIRKQNENLLDHVKMRQDFTANVSHELKTPLTSISGYAELIENKMVDDPEDIIRFAREIYRNANRLLTLINDIIRLSQFDSEEKDEVVKNEDFERIDLFAVARSCINVLAVSAQKHHVSISIKGETAYIYSTRQMMEELVFNLCDNAIRYNRENGTVDLSVWNRAGRVVLTVSDSGIGISVAHQERIFERFYRVDKSRSKSTGGTGLGLAIVKHIIARHDAELELISEIGKGTQIIISMPECL